MTGDESQNPDTTPLRSLQQRIIYTMLSPVRSMLGIPMPAPTPPAPPVGTSDAWAVQEFGMPLNALLPLETQDDINPVVAPRDATPNAPAPSPTYQIASTGFLYEGKGYTPDEFIRYVDRYDFGSVPPNFIVLHHTFRPSISTASAGAQYDWDSGEAGMTDQQIYAKRKRRLDAIRDYYRYTLGWDRGPHLFIDERYIWTFTPMFYVGIHAAEGNGAIPNYSVGIEVIGYYEYRQWAPPIARNVGLAVAAIRRRLGTFEYVHRRGPGAISSHRDYNKPTCPGAAITESYYLRVLREGWNLLQGQPPTPPAPPPTPTPTPTPPPVQRPITDMNPVIGPASGTIAHTVSYIQQRLPAGHEYENDVALIMGYYWKYAPPVGIDPFLAACQCIFETDSLRSHWAARPRRNPAGLGVHQEGGLSFSTWELGVQAHLGQLLAFGLRDDEANAAQKAMMAKNPRHARIGIRMRGSGRTIGGLNARWTDDPSYGDKLLHRVRDVAGQNTISTNPTPAPTRQYTENAPLRAPASITAQQAVAFIRSRPNGEYTDHDIRNIIVPVYFQISQSVGIDPAIPIAQMILETATLTSFWASRPQRNPAGIGVTGQTQTSRPSNTTNWAWNARRRLWEAGVSFATWENDSIPAHVGRLLAYALPRGTENAAQQQLIQRALAYRPLADAVRGSAPTLKQLGTVHNPSGNGWANPGTDYGARIAAIAQQILNTRVS